jgi:hypothetical protein
MVGGKRCLYGAGLYSGSPMNYQAFTNDSLSMMHHSARGALAVDDELSGLGQETRFKVRETADWLEHVSALEAEMLRRGMSFDAIKWSEHEVLDAPDLALKETAASDAGQTIEPVLDLRSRIAAALKIGSTN